VPFCTNCGTSVSGDANYCYRCGAAQPRTDQTFGRSSSASTASFSQGTDFLDSISNRTAAILCYIPVFGVIPAIIFLASRKFRYNPRVRFDGFQSLYLFVAWLIISSAAPILFFHGASGFGVEGPLFGLIKLSILICWIYLLVKAAKEEQVRLPVIGDLAARSATEQL
jgi:uncharacterized membrane protein